MIFLVSFLRAFFLFSFPFSPPPPLPNKAAATVWQFFALPFPPCYPFFSFFCLLFPQEARRWRKRGITQYFSPFTSCFLVLIVRFSSPPLFPFRFSPLFPFLHRGWRYIDARRGVCFPLSFFNFPPLLFFRRPWQAVAI